MRRMIRVSATVAATSAGSLEVFQDPLQNAAPHHPQALLLRADQVIVFKRQHRPQQVGLGDEGLQHEGRREEGGRAQGLHERVLEGRQEVLAQFLSAGVRSPRLAVPRPVVPTQAVRRGFRVDRRSFIGTLAGGLLAAPLAAEAQRAAKPPRVGYLGTGSASTDALMDEAFREGLREHGWIDGQNVVIEYRWSEGRLDRLPDFAAELVRQNVDVIFAPSTASTVAAQNATRTIPIVMAMVGDPVGRGIITSLARPGGNVTGLSFGVEIGYIGKQLELIKEVVPKVSRVAALGNPAEPQHKSQVGEAEGASRRLGLTLQVLQARGPSEFDRAFAAMVQDRAGALLVLSGPVYVLHRRQLADLAAKRRLPAIYNFREFADAGGLLAYGPNIRGFWRRAAAYVDRLLKGAKPADLPVEQPTKFELVINVKTAKALGLTIPQTLLPRADQVIE